METKDYDETNKPESSLKSRPEPILGPEERHSQFAFKGFSGPKDYHILAPGLGKKTRRPVISDVGEFDPLCNS